MTIRPRLDALPNEEVEKLHQQMLDVTQSWQVNVNLKAIDRQQLFASAQAALETFQKAFESGIIPLPQFDASASSIDQVNAALNDARGKLQEAIAMADNFKNALSQTGELGAEDIKKLSDQAERLAKAILDVGAAVLQVKTKPFDIELAKIEAKRTTDSGYAKNAPSP